MEQGMEAEERDRMIAEAVNSIKGKLGVEDNRKTL